jgi:hypothetical protein
MNVTLQPLTKLWQGVGGSSNFFMSETDCRNAMGSFEGSDPYHFAETLWREAQVGASRRTGEYRDGIREFVVDMPCKAAIAVCDASPTFGRGGLIQYYVPDWEKHIYPTGREYRFAEKGY